MCSVCGGRRAAGASPIRCVGERITATGVPEFREVAWRACTRSLENQMRLTAMSYNLMRVFEESSKTQQPELIHPSDKKYSEALENRQQQAQKRDRFVNPLFFQARISRISSYTIRAVQNAIITGMSLQCFMSSLVARLVSRPQLIGEH
ncbi:hypothetical protein BJAS_P3540 [Bathymodiolus japonicus methanotrophic gill symbiont]|uniref:hypothetical protein n=1 Tax=Bathymodiolus japonicus methanotrophic gill symbiont TaxID=113269 RepID=UPI001B6337C5|nr:hypothetical protein [Bathymodiolus japonicus methanotrophic gill symbiont]GFO72993.1 hypothetical protein BJAS_P3540 [Bathymodiolus japonicus methanotrophic gill symbiont]